MDDNETITIVMSVYNGALYLQQQLQSLELQTYTNWKLLVRDNGSDDNTLNILKEFQTKLGENKVFIIENSNTINEVYNSFSSLVDKVNTNLIMLCDGDDFWLPEKIIDAKVGILKMQKKYGPNIPLLYHTDLTLTNERLSVKSSSMWKDQMLNPNRYSAIKCLMHNHSIGNTYIFNKELVDIARKRPKDLIMHDVFYLLIASLFGKVSYGSESHILYRQHNKNICGGSKLMTYSNLRKKLNVKLIKSSLQRKFNLAKNLINIYGDKMSSSDKAVFMEISRLNEKGWFLRRYYIIKHKAYMNGIIRNLGMFLIL